MGLIDVFRKPKQQVERSQQLSMAFNDWASVISSFQFGGGSYTIGGTQEDIGSSYTGVARGAFMGNGIVFACMANRMQLFSEARFMYRRLRGGRPGDTFSLPDLDILRTPWTGGTTGDLLARMILHADIAGNAYVARRPGGLFPMRPDWTTIIGGVKDNADASVWHPDAEILGYAYTEGGPGSGNDPMLFLASEVAHFAPIPDPEARFRGMSWLTPIIREVMADRAMNDHKLAFLENGATPNLMVKLDVDSLDKFRQIVSDFRDQHEGYGNAYETLFLAAGADATVVGSDLSQIDFKTVQGGGETRIAAAAGIHPVIAGLSEGLQGSSLNAGNFQSARRLTADRTLRPLWRNVCGSLSQIVMVPSDAELWYDDRDIAFLQEDQKDAAEILQVDATSAVALVNGGFAPESVIEAVGARDMSLLVHTGLLSVQLQESDRETPEPPAAPTAVVPPKRVDPMDMLEDELMRMLRERDQQKPINVNVASPDVHVHPASVTVEPTHVTVEPQRWEEGAIQVHNHVDAAPAPDVNVTVEPAQVTVEPARFEEGAMNMTVEPVPAPEVTVNVEAPQVTIEKSKARRVDFGDGRTATVTEGETKHVKYDDGREVTITEVDE